MSSSNRPQFYAFVVLFLYDSINHEYKQKITSTQIDHRQFVKLPDKQVCKINDKRRKALRIIASYAAHTRLNPHFANYRCSKSTPSYFGQLKKIAKLSRYKNDCLRITCSD